MLALALAVANAYCFERCLIQSSAGSTPPCHSHGNPNISHWVEPHSLNTTAVRGGGCVVHCVMVESVAISFPVPLPRIDATGQSPPAPDLAGTTLPLRI
ncbi:MAG: hypothetical protein LAP38_24975 [Acidobacteriia bacterium]|nr:hypothetical protein [Terriglobia bacterium]